MSSVPVPQKPQFCVSMPVMLCVLAAAVSALQGCTPKQSPPPPPEQKAASQTPAGTVEAPPAVLERPKLAAPFAVVGTVPLPGDQLKSQITIFFNEDIKVEGQDKPDATPPFTMDPEFSGTYTIGKNYIDIHSDKFSAVKPVAVTLSGDIKSVGGSVLGAKARTLNFAPFTFEVRRVWQLEQSADHEVVGILFPTDVAADAVQKNTTVKDAEGNAVSATIEAGSQPDIARLKIPTGIKLPVTITIGTGRRTRRARSRWRRNL